MYRNLKEEKDARTNTSHLKIFQEVSDDYPMTALTKIVDDLYNRIDGLEKELRILQFRYYMHVNHPDAPYNLYRT